MNKRKIKYHNIINGVLLNLALSILLIFFIVKGSENTTTSSIIQEDTFRTHFQSRLILKSINGLNKSRYHLLAAQKTKNDEELLKAEDYFLAAFSDFKILLSEQNQIKGHTSNEFNGNFEELRFNFEKFMEGPSPLDENLQLEGLIKQSNSLMERLFKEESFLWVEESLRFHRFSQLKKRNQEIFYALTAFFFIIQFGLIYFTILRYRLNKKIDQQHDQLLLQTRLSTLGMMSAELAHEINSPLMVIDGRLKILQNDLSATEIDKEKLKKNLEVIKRNSGRIQSIIKSFKTLSKSGTNDPFEWIFLEHIFEEVYELVGEKIHLEKINILFIIADEQMRVEVRKIQIIQVLTNLVNNSIEAIRNHDEKWIKIEAKDHNELLFVTVTDSGNGISSEQQVHIFEAFYSTKTSNEGTGLGLSISKKIMKEHNGDLTYETNHPNTQFKLSFRNKKTRDERGPFI